MASSLLFCAVLIPQLSGAERSGEMYLEQIPASREMSGKIVESQDFFIESLEAKWNIYRSLTWGCIFCFCQ